MMIAFRPRALFAAAAAVLLAALVAQGAAAQSLPFASELDLRESYRLMTTTYYRKVDRQTLLDAGRSTLVDLAATHGVKTQMPPLSANDDDAALDQLGAAIARTSVKIHLPVTQVTYITIEGMARALGDRYTQFLTPDQYREFNSVLDPEKIYGIGVLVDVNPQTQFIRATFVVPDTPADRAGIRSGDDLASIDGTSTKGFKIEDASKRLRGKPGTTVHIAVVRDGAMMRRPFAIVRSEVQPPTVIYKMLGRVGYIYVLAFGRGTPGEFTTALDRVRKGGARALVLDLRNDGGGYVDSALDISSHFISNKPLLTVEDRGSHTTTIEADNNPVPLLPMTVLVNQYTASASEITAGAIQDDGVGTLVGAKTFGKGLVQTLTPLAGGAAIKITTAHYLTPNNHDINLRGIEPDLRVDENKDARFGELDHDAQLRAAVDLLEKKIAEAHSP
jgi:carboxyl-terminal processing protease